MVGFIHNSIEWFGLFLDSADGILDECEASGEAAGIIVALAACSVLKNKCPPPPSTLARSQLDLLPDGEQELRRIFCDTTN